MCLRDNQLKAEELLLFVTQKYLAVQHDHYDQPSMADEVINGFAAGDGYHPSIAVPLINHLVSASKKDILVDVTLMVTINIRHTQHSSLTVWLKS